MIRADAHLIKAAEGLLDRLRVFKKIALGARERGETVVELHVEEVWEASDELALLRFEAAVAQAKGERPLAFVAPEPHAMEVDHA